LGLHVFMDQRGGWVHECTAGPGGQEIRDLVREQEDRGGKRLARAGQRGDRSLRDRLQPKKELVAAWGKSKPDPRSIKKPRGVKF